MYSKTIKRKVEEMFSELKKRVSAIVGESMSTDEIIREVTRVVSSELSTRSRTILSDMLFELSDSLLKTDFFSDVARQNKFFEINLRQEILNKYRFDATTSVKYEESSKTLQALKVGGITFAAGAAIEIGSVLIAGLSFPALVPIPISILVAASIGAALTDYYVIEPARNKKKLALALEDYLLRAQQQFLQWFDEIENYFNARVEEIKKTM